MSIVKWCLLWCLAVAVTRLAVAADDVAVQHAEPLQGYRVAAASTVAAADARSVAALGVRFTAFGRDFAIELEPNARLAGLNAKLSLPPGTAAYRGRIAGRAESWVRLVLSDRGPVGLVFDGQTLYGIEHDVEIAAKRTAGPSMFRLADVYVAPGALACGTTAASDGAEVYRAMLGELAVLAAQGATLNLDLAAVADFEFSNAFGANAEAELLARFNNVDGIFTENLGVQITVADVEIFTTSADPFTTTDANDLLDELAIYRGAAREHEAFGLTHLYTGRNLDGMTAGVAFLGTVCATRTPFDRRSFGVGLSEGRRGTTIDSLIAAHEIGHNFGAPHDAEAGSPCEATAPTFLMAPSVSGSDFSPCSIAEIQKEIAGATCLVPIGDPNVTVTTPDASRDVLAGTAFDYVLDVANLGVGAADNVVLEVEIAPEISVASASSGGQACTIMGGNVSCALGTIGGGSTRRVTLTLSGTVVGTFAVAAVVAADQNAIAGDDTLTGSITVAPVVDLVVTGSGTALQPNAQTTLAVNVVNAADYAATAMTVTATLSAGLRADQASAEGTPCTVSGQVVTCAPRTLAARATLPLSLTVTGTASGTQQIALAATAAEAERVPSDNQLSLAINVAAVDAGGGGGGGGGGASPWLALGLLAVWMRERRRRGRGGR